MTTEPDEGVTVILPTLNADRFLQRALDSIRLQGSLVREVLVVDGGSTDATLTIASREQAIILGGPGTTLIDAWNMGIHSASHQWIAFLDVDDEWTSGALASHFRAMSAEPRGQSAVASTGRVRFRQEQAALPRGFRGELLDEPRLGWMPGSTILRTDVARQLGDFSTALGLASDIEWFDRLRLNEHVALNDEVVLIKSVRSDSVSLSGSRPEDGESQFSADVLRLARMRINQRPSSTP